MAQITSRFKECGLEINSEKSRIVYRKDRNRHEEHEAISFDFLGFTFRPRRCVSECHGVHPNFLPAISRASMKALNREIRSWHVQLRNDYNSEFHKSQQEREIDKLLRHFANLALAWQAGLLTKKDVLPVQYYVLRIVRDLRLSSI